MRTYAPALVLCALSLAPTLVAHAADPVVYKPCDKKPSPDDVEAAKGLFSAGKVSYNEADYSKAIQLWRDAFERDCTALPLLQNLANAYEKAGNIDGAIVTLDTFIKRDPQNPDVPTIQKRIDNLRKLPKTGPTATPTPPVTTSAPPLTTTAPPATTSAPPGNGKRSSTPLIVAGIGGAVAIIGGLTYLGGKSKLKSADDKCPDRSKCGDQSAIDDGNSGRNQVNAGGALFVVGLVGAGAGLAWYFLTKPEEKAASRYLAPALSPGFAGLSLGGRF